MDPTQRFSARADVYAQARPGYPTEVLDILRMHHGLREGAAVADLGAGTGIFTRLLLESGATVHAVEPNDDMRAEAERTLGGEPRFASVAGRAEATTLEDASVDLVTAAQAFHWFDLEPTRREIARILRPEGHAAFVWNDRDLGGTPFLCEYEDVLRQHCPGYLELQGKSDATEKLDAVFGPGGWSRHTAPNAQQLDRVGLVRRVMSASYAPPPETTERQALVAALEEAFDRHAENAIVTLSYTTVVIGGRPRRP